MGMEAVTLFAGPGTLRCAPSLRNGNGSILFNYVVDGTIRTLSNNNTPLNQDSFKGLLYVPSLESSSICNNITASYIPTSVTRRTDLSPGDNPHDDNNDSSIIALAPWVTRECSLDYIAASNADGVKALIFYFPDIKDSSKPPAADDSVWNLGDANNTSWEKESKYPVYAVPGPAGTNLMHQLSEYSGRNRETAAAASISSGAKSVNECARLYTLIDLAPNQSSGLSGVWVFILSILGAIILILAFAYLALRFLQRKRRESLQRQLVTGEVDMESLGFKRLVVPPHILSSLPVYVYPGEEAEGQTETETESEKQNTSDTQIEQPKDRTVTTTEIPVDDVDHMPKTECVGGGGGSVVVEETFSSVLEEILPPAPPPKILGKRRRHTPTLTFSQNTCAICLEDYVPRTSLIRELPCTHVFHPECIDTFLMRDGSTCPVCKQSVLPQAFIEEQINSFMIQQDQRIQMLRHLRQRQEQLQLERRQLNPRRHRHNHNRRHQQDGARTTMHGDEMLDSQARIEPSSNGLIGRFRAWLSRQYNNENRVARDETVSSAPQEDIQRPQRVTLAPPAGESIEGQDPGRREMIQARVMVLLGSPVNH